jgi:hypothetical protein
LFFTPACQIKFGLLQLSEGLAFLGNEAGMVHRGISTETVLVSLNGSFKISGEDSPLRPSLLGFFVNEA